jgi:xylulokinase
MGTAEALVGVYQARVLGETEFRSGFAFGCHVLPDLKYWMGGLSASGGSIEWLCRLLGENTLTYDELSTLAAKARHGPSGILYFPYLAGSGSPHTDIQVRAALIGLDAAHSREDVCKAILEGTALEIEFILSQAGKSLELEIEGLLASGGGTRNPLWMQIKSDIMGIPVRVPRIEEAALLGAALIAGMGCSLYANADEALASHQQLDEVVYLPDPANHRDYLPVREHYLIWQRPLRELSHFPDNP